MTSTQGSKVKALCVGTRCVDVDQFVSTFHRFCDDETFFVATLTMRPVGLETAFSIQLADKTPVLRGLCIVREAWTTPDNPFGRPGIRLGIVRLTRESTAVYTRLRTKRASTSPVVPLDPVPVSMESVTAALPIVDPKPPPVPRMTPPARVPAIPRMTPPAIPTVRATSATPTPEPAPAKTPISPTAFATRAIAPGSAMPGPRDLGPRDRGLQIAQRLAATAKPAPPAIAPQLTDVTTTESTSVDIAISEPAAEPAAAEPAAEPAAAESAAEPAAAEPAAESRPTEVRTPGSEYVLPANPLMNLTDDSLEGFVDCTLYEETGVFPLDEVTPVPLRQPRAQSVILPPIEPPLVSPSMAFAAIDAPEPVVENDAVASVIDRPPTADGPASLRSASMGFDAVEPRAVGAMRFETPMPAHDEVPPSTGFESPQQGYAAVDTPMPPRWVEPARADASPSSLDSSAMAMRPERPRKRARTLVMGPRWWIIGAASLAAVVLVVVLITRSRASGDALPPDEPHDRVVTPKPPPPKNPGINVVAADAGVETDPPGTPEHPETAVGPPVVGKGPCRISIVAEPAGAAVQIDGEAAGPAPISIDGPCQKRRIDLAHPRYASTTRWATPTAGKPETVDVTLTRPTHSVTVVTQPAGATVSIDGRRAGTSPTIVQIMGFQSMSLTVDKPGYQSVTQRVYSKVPNDKVVIKLTSNLFPPKTPPPKKR